MRLKALKVRALAFELIVFLVVLFVVAVTVIAWGVGVARAGLPSPSMPSTISAFQWLTHYAPETRIKFISTTRVHIWYVPRADIFDEAPTCFVLYSPKTLSNMPKVNGVTPTSFGLNDLLGGSMTTVQSEAACWAYR